MMRLSGLGVGHLEYKARAVHRLVVEDEPNWSELCSTTTAPGQPGPTGAESDDDGSDDDDDAPEDPDNTF